MFQDLIDTYSMYSDTSEDGNTLKLLLEDIDKSNVCIDTIEIKANATMGAKINSFLNNSKSPNRSQMILINYLMERHLLKYKVDSEYRNNCYNSLPTFLETIDASEIAYVGKITNTSLENDLKLEDSPNKNLDILYKFPEEQIKVEEIKCELCGKALSNISALSRHKKELHLSLSDPFICEICDKTFKRKYTYEKHRKSHGNKRELYSCRICKKTYNEKFNLNKHMKKKHTS